MFRRARTVSVAWAAALGSLVGGTSGAESARSQRYALLVGVDDYSLHADDALQDLSFCAADMESLRKKLEEIGFKRTYCLATRSTLSRQPTKAQIQRALELLLGEEAMGPEDLVLVALSGHGLEREGVGGRKTAYFCPADGHSERIETLIPMSWFYERLQESKAGMKVMLVDACRNLATTRAGGAKPELAAEARGFMKSLSHAPPRGIAVLLSCEPGQFSHEVPEWEHGVFMHYVLEGLSGKADAEGNQDGEVSLLELYAYANLYTKRFVLRNRPGYVQTPVLLGEVARDFVIGRPLAPPMARAPFSAGLARAHQQAWAKYLDQPVELANSIGMKLVLIPPGEFMMGSPEDEEGRDDDEGPQHPVRITRPFYLGVYEVTQEEYERVMGSSPSWFSRGGRGSGRVRVSGLDTSRFPVASVSWEDAVAFCRRLSCLPAEQRAGRVYRLPTEAEWEYACRAGTTTPFHFATHCNGRRANCDGRFPYGTSSEGPHLERPTTVGSYGCNAFGLYDMHGNVWEWCADWYDEDYYANSPVDDPRGPTSGSDRVIRGGCWSNNPGRCRSAHRGRLTPGYRRSYLGFRLASDLVDASGR